MRISDWSSDVCSSDLIEGLGLGRIRTLSLCKTPRAQKVRMAQNPGRGSSAALGRAVGDSDRGTGLAAGDCSRRGARADPRMSDKSSERSEEHTSELQSLMRISYAVFCWKKKRALKHTH